MKRVIGVGLALAMLAMPALAAAKPIKPAKVDRVNAAKECKAERAEIGVEAFRDKYGANRGKRNAYGRCVRQGARANARERRVERRVERRNAAKDCRAERAEIGVEAFRDKYGSGPRNRNAFGKCVSRTVKANREEEREPEVEVETEATVEA